MSKENIQNEALGVKEGNGGKREKTTVRDREKRYNV